MVGWLDGWVVGWCGLRGCQKTSNKQREGGRGEGVGDLGNKENKVISGGGVTRWDAKRDETKVFTWQIINLLSNAHFYPPTLCHSGHSLTSSRGEMHLHRHASTRLVNTT